MLSAFFFAHPQISTQYIRYGNINVLYKVNIYFYLFIQNLYSALFTNKRALMRYSKIKSITKSYYSESKNTYE